MFIYGIFACLIHATIVDEYCGMNNISNFIRPQLHWRSTWYQIVNEWQRWHESVRRFKKLQAGPKSARMQQPITRFLTQRCVIDTRHTNWPMGNRVAQAVNQTVGNLTHTHDPLWLPSKMASGITNYLDEMGPVWDKRSDVQVDWDGEAFCICMCQNDAVHVSEWRGCRQYHVIDIEFTAHTSTKTLRNETINTNTSLRRGHPLEPLCVFLHHVVRFPE